MSTDLPEKEVPEAEVAPETNGDSVKASGSSEDVLMEDETEKMQRAARQSACPGHGWFVCLWNNTIMSPSRILLCGLESSL